MAAEPIAVQTSLADLRRVHEAPLPAVSAGFFDLQSFELMQRVAKGFASSTLVPKEYQGNVANCMIALNLARRINGDPLMVMQSLVIVHGRPTWASQFMIATVNMCGRFSALRFEFFGPKGSDDWGCRAWSVEKTTGEKLVGSDITIALAKKEGWYTRNGSKWQSMPQQMLMYRAGSWWARAYAPELSMGLMAADEARDTFDAGLADDGTWTVESADDLRPSHAAAGDAQSEAEPVDVSGMVEATPSVTPIDGHSTEHLLQCVLDATTLEELDFVRGQNKEREASKMAKDQVSKAIDNKAKALQEA